VTLTVSVLHDDGLALLALGGELDVAVTGPVEDAVGDLLADGFTRLVVDLSALTFCDSTGPGALMRTHGLLVAAGGSCLIAGAHGPVDRLLRLMHMDRVLELVPDVATALHTLQQGSR